MCFLGVLMIDYIIAEERNEISPKMANNQTLTLIYPQWQGGDITSFFKDLTPSEAARGYMFGAKMLALLAIDINPNLANNSVIVDISLDFNVDSNGKRIIKGGIIDRDILQSQAKAALTILHQNKPRKILTLGGECSVSVPSFSYLSYLYNGDVALVWIDAHPDLGVPYDDFYKGYHAMAVSAIIGDSGLKEIFNLPYRLDSSKVALVGLHSKEARHYTKRQKSLGIVGFSPKEIAKNSENLLSWLKKIGAKRVMIHLDLDVLDKNELYIAVGNTGKLSIAQLTRLVGDISREYEVVGLSIAEHLPKDHIKLKGLLEAMPLVVE